MAQSPPFRFFVHPFTPGDFTYALDARLWSPALLRAHLLAQNAAGVAYRCHLAGISAPAFLELTESSLSPHRDRLLFNPYIEKLALSLSRTFRRNTAACVLQRAIRHHMHLQEERNYYHCAHVVQEFLATEETYCEQLHTVIELIYKPLLASDRGVLTADQIHLLFGNLAVIEGVNRALLQNLKEQLPSYSKSCLFGKILLSFTPYMKLYSEYCKIYPQMLDLINSFKPSHPFSVYFKEQMKLAPPAFRRFYLAAFLITPVQRLPRYRMMLESLVKHMAPTHIDYGHILLALNEIEKVTEFVNTASRKKKEIDMVMGLQVSVKGLPPSLQLLQADRQFIATTSATLSEKWFRFRQNGRQLELPAAEFARTFRPDAQPLAETYEVATHVELYLFNDLVLVLHHAGRKAETLAFRHAFDVGEATVMSEEPFERGVLPRIIIAVGGVFYLFALETPDATRRWLELLNDTCVARHEVLESLKRRRSTPAPQPQNA